MNSSKRNIGLFTFIVTNQKYHTDRLLIRQSSHQFYSYKKFFPLSQMQIIHAEKNEWMQKKNIMKMNTEKNIKIEIKQQLIMSITGSYSVIRLMQNQNASIISRKYDHVFQKKYFLVCITIFTCKSAPQLMTIQVVASKNVAIFEKKGEEYVRQILCTNQGD